MAPNVMRAQRREATVPGSLDRPGQPHAPDEADTHQMLGQLRPAPPRPEPPPYPDHPGEARPADHAATTDQPMPWSRADLRQRLERLPPGHPSSPHTADLSRNHPSGLRDLDVPSPRDKTEQDHGGRPEAITPGSDGPDREPDAIKRDYWGEVPRFLRMWADHVRRWPAERVAAAVDRSRDPAGSWRGDGGQYMDSKEHAQAKDMIARVQRAEKTLTGHMKETERENACGGWLEGMKFRLKDEDRLKEKIADLSHTSAPDATTEEIVRKIPDAIRYTFCAEPTNYKDAYWDIKGRLQARGYTMSYSENHWSDTQYKGINTRWTTSEGQRFEVQFHTPESFHVKQKITHASYERLRNPLTEDGERRELMTFQQELCSWITVPEGVADIPNYREEGR
jgi:hypothetical protein